MTVDCLRHAQLLEKNAGELHALLVNAEFGDAVVDVNALHEIKDCAERARETLDNTLKRLEDIEKSASSGHAQNLSVAESSKERKWPLLLQEYTRYGRQLILPEIGLDGQLRLKKSSVLVIGVGGLGCPAAAYLAGAGVGKLGLVDGDHVDLSNLHRQILHSTATLGISKVESAKQTLNRLNPLVEIVAHAEPLTTQNALSIVSAYDVVLDCTDHPTSRYLISDAAVLCQKPIISASALRTEGQMIVLNSPSRPAGDGSGGPCYRCIFPRPPPPESIVSCGEGGILGPVVGTMGVLQALETIKLIAKGFPRPPSSEVGVKSPMSKMLLFSALNDVPFRSVKMRGRRADCAACSETPTVTADSLVSGSLDYVKFCGTARPVNLLEPGERISAQDYSALAAEEAGTLVDVREPVEYSLASLPGSINLPISNIMDLENFDTFTKLLPVDMATERPIHFICRLGNDSQLAVRKVLALTSDSRSRAVVRDVRGGYKAWKKEVDYDWPEY